MTEMTIFQKNLMEKLPNVELRFDEPMSRHTSFRIGGPVAVMAFPKSGEELAEILKVSALMDIEPAILGAGTNVLAPDEGSKRTVDLNSTGYTFILPSLQRDSFWNCSIDFTSNSFLQYFT